MGAVKLVTKGMMVVVNSLQYAAVLLAIVRDAHNISVQF
jgi:hypothetical protein